MEKYIKYLREQEKSEKTIEKYVRDIKTYCNWCRNPKPPSSCGRGTACGGGIPSLFSKQTLTLYKQHLSQNYTFTSANSMLASLNSYLKFIGKPELCVRQFKVQKKTYRSEDKELTKGEYKRLIKAAKGNRRLDLIIQTICTTGIRVSELRFIDKESVVKGEFTVTCKNKTRTVFIVRELRKKLIKYIEDNNITGTVFVTKSGKPVDRISIWRDMKKLCRKAEVSPSKVFPHNLRHLFARTFYGIEKDIAKLADILGHSSIDTTRIYIITTGAEHRRRMENMRLVI